MKKAEKGAKKTILYEGLGFPVVLVDCPMMMVRGWSPGY